MNKSRSSIVKYSFPVIVFVCSCGCVCVCCINLITEYILPNIHMAHWAYIMYENIHRCAGFRLNRREKKRNEQVLLFSLSAAIIVRLVGRSVGLHVFIGNWFFLPFFLSLFYILYSGFFLTSYEPPYFDGQCVPIMFTNHDINT